MNPNAFKECPRRLGLYGVMPANGLVYAGPHDCACYPETKLYGLNAMVPKIEAIAIRMSTVIASLSE